MNAKRRKSLHKEIKLLEEAKGIIEDVQCEEEESYDNLSEGLQQSSMGETLSENSSTLEDVVSSIEDLIDEVGSM